MFSSALFYLEDLFVFEFSFCYSGLSHTLWQASVHNILQLHPGIFQLVISGVQDLLKDVVWWTENIFDLFFVC